MNTASTKSKYENHHKIPFIKRKLMSKKKSKILFWFNSIRVLILLVCIYFIIENFILLNEHEMANIELEKSIDSLRIQKERYYKQKNELHERAMKRLQKQSEQIDSFINTQNK